MNALVGLVVVAVAAAAGVWAGLTAGRRGKTPEEQIEAVLSHEEEWSGRAVD